MTAIQPEQLRLPLFERPRRRRTMAPEAESEALYEAIVLLRRSGIPVYRAGADHKVGDAVLTTAELLTLVPRPQGL